MPSSRRVYKPLIQGMYYRVYFLIESIVTAGVERGTDEERYLSSEDQDACSLNSPGRDLRLQ